MRSIWWTADNHIDHANIIDHCKRPFKSVKHMNECLTESWNQYVKPGDTIIVLGDFHWSHNTDLVLAYAKTLHGQKVFIKGNHDRWYKREKRYMYNKKVDGIIVWGCHYPLVTWPSGIMLHGHSHGTLPKHRNRFDVGVDTNHEYRPYHHDEIKLWVDWDFINRRAREGRETEE